MVKEAPVTKRPSGLASHATIPAISSASPKRGVKARDGATQAGLMAAVTGAMSAWAAMAGAHACPSDKRKAL